MKIKDELKRNYIKEITNKWDKETLDEYLSFVEDDFEIYYEGYIKGQNDMIEELRKAYEYGLSRGSLGLRSDFDNYYIKIKDHGN
jgi:hypothetical protein